MRAALDERTKVRGVSLEDIFSSYAFFHSESTLERQAKIETGSVKGSFTLGLATTKEELCEIFNLRYLSHKENNYINPGFVFPGEMEFDTYDGKSAIFYSRCNATDKLCGTARLVFEKDGKLPLDAYCDLEIFRKTHELESTINVEFSRLISYPVGQGKLNKELIRLVYDFVVEKNIDYILGCARQDIPGYYYNMGFKPVLPKQDVDLRKLNPPVCGDMNLFPVWMSRKDICWKNLR